MIDFTGLLPVERVLIQSEISTRKVALRTLARTLAEGCEKLGYREIYFALEERESQASTVLDEAPVAIPHCRLDDCECAVAALLLVDTEQGMIFGEDRVKLFFGLCVPAKEQSLPLQILQQVVQLIADTPKCEELLVQNDPVELHRLFQASLALVISS